MEENLKELPVQSSVGTKKSSKGHSKSWTGYKLYMEPAQKERFKERGSAEWVNSNLKDNFGGRFARVRDAAKIMAHLMFGLIALTANQLFNLLGTLAKGVGSQAPLAMPYPQLE